MATDQLTTTRLAPTLATERLVLRPIVLDDFAEYAKLMASPRSKYMGGPFSMAGAWGLFCHEVALWHLAGHGGLSIELRATSVCVGQVGINHGPLFPERELGWQLYEGHEGNGYVTEAARALRDWAFDELGLATLVSYFDPANSRSIAVAERLGGVLDSSAPRQDETDLVFRYTPQS
jgi:RimJ/RimL family protein N-acetyltransferase